MLRLGEIFCGGGGMVLGSSRAKIGNFGFGHAWVIDNNPDGCETIRKNGIVDPDRIYVQDVKSIDFQNMPSIDGLAFGFPCNDYSLVGRRRGIDGEYGELYQYGVKCLEVLQPFFFVAENVSGISSSGAGRDFPKILAALTDAGYDVTTQLYRFEDYGVPQTRHRYIIVGFRKDLHIQFAHPLPMSKTLTASQALSNIPDDAANHEFTEHTPIVVERLKYVQPGLTLSSSPGVPKELDKKTPFHQSYRRIHPDCPSPTVLAGGGGTLLFHWKENRVLTNREFARLQTFPDWYTFAGSRGSVLRQIGMAVPPFGAKIIFQSVLRYLMEVKQ